VAAFTVEAAAVFTVVGVVSPVAVAFTAAEAFTQVVDFMVAAFMPSTPRLAVGLLTAEVISNPTLPAALPAAT
jgi:hypothetical protein